MSSWRRASPQGQLASLETSRLITILPPFNPGHGQRRSGRRFEQFGLARSTPGRIASSELESGAGSATGQRLCRASLCTRHLDRSFTRRQSSASIHSNEPAIDVAVARCAPSTLDDLALVASSFRRSPTLLSRVQRSRLGDDLHTETHPNTAICPSTPGNFGRHRNPSSSTLFSLCGPLPPK